MPAQTGKSGRGIRALVARVRTGIDTAGERMPVYLPGFGGSARQLMLVPQDLRTADPSLAAEYAVGQLGLAGAVATLDGRSPFEVPPPSSAWERALHEFDWLRDLRSADSAEASDDARALVGEWIDGQAARRGIAWQADVTARRLISWLSNGGMLLDDVATEDYERVVRSLDRQLDHLVETRDRVPHGRDRLLLLNAVMLAALCLSGRDELIAGNIARFALELDRQVLPDGGHVSRNPGALVEVLLDLLPLRQCFVTRDIPAPPALGSAIGRALPMLRHMTFGDGTLARFNGMGATAIDRLAAVLAFDDGLTDSLEPLPVSRYARLAQRGTAVIVDAGKPPPLELSGGAHAGCLSFEMYSGPYPVIVNCGAPGSADEDWRQIARGTAAHSTLVLNFASSGRLHRRADLERRMGAIPLVDPSSVDARVTIDADGAMELAAGHNGYVDRFGLTHSRLLRLSADGSRLEGIDRVYSPGVMGTLTAPLRGLRNIPFAAHFHIHPTATMIPGEEPQTIDIKLANGEVWRLAAKGAEMSLEESIFQAHFAGPLRSVQAVLRGIALDNTEIRWRIERTTSPVRPV